MKEKAFGFRY